MTRWRRRKITKHIKNTYVFTIGKTKYSPVRDYCTNPVIIFYYKIGGPCEYAYCRMKISVYKNEGKWGYCPNWFSQSSRKSSVFAIFCEAYTELCVYPTLEDAIHEGLQYANRAMALNGFPSDANKALKKMYRKLLPVTPRWKEIILRIWKTLF